jgi:hypothetical protein
VPQRLDIHLIGSVNEVSIISFPATLLNVRKISRAEIVVEHIVGVESNLIADFENIQSYKVTYDIQRNIKQVTNKRKKKKQ